MTDFFKSAFSNIFSNQNVTKSNTSSTTASDDFVGRNILIGSYKLRIIKQLAEGGYAIVYLAQDITNGTEYAVKRMFAADRSANKAIIDEINFLKQVNNHPYILKFVAAACEDKDSNMNGGHTRNEYLVLTELCKGGSLIDFIRANELNNEQVLQVFYQVTKAVQFLHSQTPAIIHRDIKIDNFLITNDGTIKLCDFGSATIQEYYPDDSWTANKRSLTEDEIAKQTTPMYRAPEMLDLYSNYPINKQSDIWALGCVLYAMCFNKHPFEDSAKLRIINGNYTIPQNSEFNDYHDLIRCMFNIDPRQRPTIDEVVYHLENIAETRQVEFTPKLRFLVTNNRNLNQTTTGNGAAASLNQQQAVGANGDSSKWMGNAASLLKGGIKTIKDASTKVIDTMQQTINRTDIDMSYITSRLIVMSCPTEGIESTAFGNNIDLVKEAIERRHSLHYTVYNLSNKTYHKEKFTKVIDVNNLNSSKAPPLTLICKVCANIIRFLEQNPKNVVVIHCNDGKALSAVLTCSILLIYGIANNVDSSLLIFNMKRSCSTCINPSQYRFLSYIDKLVNEIPPFVPLSNEFTLTGITIQTVPVFNRARNGCTPYFEVYCKDTKVFTNFVTYEALRKYTSNEPQIHFNVNCKLYGDVTILVYHAKSILGGGKLTSLKIGQIQFHTGFLDNNKLRFRRHELDGVDTPDKYPDGFSIGIDIEMKSVNSAAATEEAWNLVNLSEFKNPQNLFNTVEELNELILLLNASNKPYNDFSPDSKTVGQSKFFADVEDGSNQFQPTTFVDREQREGMLEDVSDNEDDLANQFNDGLKMNAPPPATKISNLLDFDDGTTDEAATTPANNAFQTQASTNSGFANFDLLVDLDAGTAGTTQQIPVNNNNNSNNSNSNSFANFDLFSNPQPEASASSTSNLNDLLNFDSLSSNRATTPSTTATSTKPQETIFDPFGSSFADTPLIQPVPSQSNIRPNLSQSNLLKQQPPQQQAQTNSFDPFANLTNFSGNTMKQQTSTPNLLNQPKPSVNNLFASKPTSPQESPMHKPNYNIPGSTFLGATAPKPTGSNPNLNTQQQQQPKPAAANTNSFNFSSFSTTAPPTNGGGKSTFDEFLPGEFLKSTKAANMSLKDMKRETSAKEMDPDRVRVADWTDGKKKNIRALLCSMDKVLWEGENKWKSVGMHDLVTADQVKKAFRRAVLVVHPDKLTDHPQLNLARLIFIELNTAWEQFEQEGQKNLF